MTTYSVGICAHNEEETIGALLDQVLAEDVDYEDVIVVAAGDDGTKEIVREKQRIHDEVTLIEEAERRGQSAAQDTIMQHADADVLLLVDGDGLLVPGSLELLVDAFDGRSILYGREIPVVRSTFTGNVIQAFWDMHHRLSLRKPKYTTQLALLPSTVIERLPHTVVADDEYIGWKAREQGFSIEYVPDAVKLHRVKPDIGSFMRHSRKNWLGMIQVTRSGYEENLQPSLLKIGFFIDQLLWESSLREKWWLVFVGLVESVTFIQAWLQSLDGSFPYIWER